MLVKNKLCLPNLVFFYNGLVSVHVAIEETELLDFDT